MDRRRLLATVAAAGGAATLAGCQGNGPGAEAKGDSSKSAKSVTVYSNSDTNIRDLWKKHLIPKFEKDNPGIKVKFQFDQHGENVQQIMAKLAAATKQNKDSGIDLLEEAGDRAGQADLLADPTGHISNLNSIPKSIMSTVEKNAVPYRGSSVLLAYLPDKVSHPPKSLHELLEWIKKHPGKFTYNKPGTGGSGDSFVQTVLSYYLSDQILKKMTSGYHKNLEKHWGKGFSVLANLNKDMYQNGVYPSGNNGPMKLMENHQIWMLPAWSDQFLSSQEHGTIPKEAKAIQITHPSFTGGATEMGVPKASPRKKQAFKMMNWLLEPEQQATIAKSISGYPAIPMSKLPKKLQSRFADADVGHLRPGFNDDMINDMHKLWSEKVPGH